MPGGLAGVGHGFDQMGHERLLGNEEKKKPGYRGDAIARLLRERVGRDSAHGKDKPTVQAPMVVKELMVKGLACMGAKLTSRSTGCQGS